MSKISYSNLLFADNNQLRLGTGSDLRIYHNGSNSFIQDTGTGDLRLMSSHLKLMDTSENLVLGVQAGAVAVTGTLTVGVDDTGHDVKFFGATAGSFMLWDESDDSLELTDSTYIKLGDSGDFKMWHDGSNTYLSNEGVGHVYIQNTADDKDIIFKSDNGSGGTAEYFRVDGSLAEIIFSRGTRHMDNKKATFGSGQDLQIYHDGTNSYIHNDTGDLRIENDTTDGDIIFRSDDGSGGLSTYFRVDGGLGKTIFPDNQTLGIGSSGDFNLTHDGSNSYIKNDTGDLYIQQSADNSRVRFQADDGAGGITSYFDMQGSAATHDGSATTATFTQWYDNSRIALGNGYDVQLWHDSTNTIFYNQTGNLTFQQAADDADIIFQSDDGSGGLGEYFRLDGSQSSASSDYRYTRWQDYSVIALGNGNDLQLWHDASNSRISNYTGDLYITQELDDKDIILVSDDGSGGTTAYLTIDGGDEQVKVWKNLTLDDNIQAWFGSGNDLRIYHDGSDSYIEQAGNGSLVIYNSNNDADIRFRCDDGSGGVATYFSLDGSIAGGDGAGTLFTIWPDSSRIGLGGNADLRMYHDGTDSKIINLEGSLQISQYVDDGDIIFQSDDGSGGVTTYMTIDGSATRTVFNENAQLVDGKYLYFGTGSDAHVRHSGSAFTVTNTAGDITILNATDDGDIIFQADDGSGGNATYLTLDGGISSLIAYRDLLMATDGDNGKIKLGASQDLQFYHASGTSNIYNQTGSLVISNDATDMDIIFKSDDGSGGLATYFQLDGSHTETVFSQNARFADNAVAKFGDSSDLQIYHNASNSYIYQVGTGDLHIVNSTDDKDIVFSSDDGSGGVTEYLRLDGSSVFTIASKTINWIDGVYGSWGSSGDLLISHNSTNSLIDNYTGDLYIRNFDNDKDIIFASDNGSGGDATYFRLDGSEVETRFHKATLHYDSIQAKYGDSGDLQIQHNGTDSQITNSTGHLQFTNTANNSDISFASDNGAGSDTIYFFLDGSAAEHDGSATTALFTQFPDKSIASFGSSNDLRLYHDGSNSQIFNYNGHLYIKNHSNDSNIAFECDDTSGGLTEYFRLDGGLGYTVASKHILLNDNVKLRVGSSADLEILHDGSNSYIHHNGTGSLYMKADTGNIQIINYTNDADIVLQSDDGSGGVTPYITLDGSVGYTIANKAIRALDSVNLQLGASADFTMQHNGTNTVLQNFTGDLQITQGADDGDIIFQSDDGSGGVETYFFLDGSTGHTQFPDAKKLQFGSSNDMFIEHDGSNSYISSDVGTFYIRQTLNDGDLVLTCDDGSGGNTAYLTLDGSAGVLRMTKDMYIPEYIYHQGDDNTYFGFSGADTYVLATGGTTALTVNSSQAATFAGDVQAAGLYVGSTNTSFDFYNNGTSYLNGATTIDDNTQINGTLTVGVDDTGYDVKFYGATTSRFLHWDESEDYLLFRDNVKGVFGTSADLKLYHDSNNSYIENATGNLYIMARATDADIYFTSDDGSGGDTEYFRVDGGEGRLVHSVNSRYLDNTVVMIGSGADLQIKHDGTDSTITNTTGNFNIYQNTDDGDIRFYNDNGSGGTTEYFRVDGNLGVNRFLRDVRYNDSIKAKFGTGEDLEIFSDGNDGFINNVTNHLYITNNANDCDLVLRSDDGSGGVTAYLTLDGSAGYTTVQKNMQFADGVYANFGASSDIEITHVNDQSYIINNTGNLEIRQNTDDGDIIFSSDDGSGGTQTYLTIDGGADRTIFSRSSRHNDGVVAAFGASEDLQIYHDGSNSYIVDGGTGSLKIQTSQITINNAAGNEAMINATQDGAVNLYYNGQGPKISTGNYGPNFKYSVTGTTDGNSAGDVVHLGETTTVAGKIYYYKSDGAWALVDADAASTCSGLLAVALGTSSSTNGMLLRGMVTIANDPGAVGDTLFASTTAGEATATAPSGSGDIVRVIGYCLDASNGQIWFNPDGAFVEVA